MSSSSKSREHHWWPVGLQKYWMDRHGQVSWIDPDGKIDNKRVKNRKIAYKSHGHTMLRGTRGETNFEDEFSSADDKAPKVVETLLGLKPLGRTPAEFLGLLVKRPRHLRDMCRFYHLDEDIHRLLLLLLLSLLIRSPANRFRYENYPARFGLPPSDDVGKANMHQQFRIAKKLCETGLLSNQYFVLIHSPRKKFVFGDGSLDWLTGSLNGLNIDGRTLMTLMPHLCVYFCTPHAMRPTPNCASLSAAPWMVDWINDIVQIYARDRLFFLGRPPVLTDAFRQRRFREHAPKTDQFIDMLDEVAGNRFVSSIFGRDTFQFMQSSPPPALSTMSPEGYAGSRPAAGSRR